MSRTVYAGALLAIALVLGGCADTVSGNGAPGGTPGPPTASSGAPSSDTQASTPPPSPSGSEHVSTSAEPPASNLACPNVIDPASQLAYTCIAPGMQLGAPSSMWPVRFEKTVDVQWTMDEGSGPVDAPGSDVTSVAKVLSTTMASGNYGPKARATVQRDVDVSVSGKKAHLVETLMTIDPAYRKGRGLKVASERLWIVAVQVASDQITAWYVSVPDVQKALWPKVPDLIEQLKVV